MISVLHLDGSCRHPNLLEFVDRSERRLVRTSLLCAKLAVNIRKISFTLKKFEQKDAACFVRRSIAEGRAAGPSTFASALRSILKCGRMYRQPNIASGLLNEHGLVFDKESVLLELGKHFAEAEHGSLTHVGDLLERRDSKQQCVDVSRGYPRSLPSLLGCLICNMGKLLDHRVFRSNFTRATLRERHWFTIL